MRNINELVVTSPTYVSDFSFIVDDYEILQDSLNGRYEVKKDYAELISNGILLNDNPSDFFHGIDLQISNIQRQMFNYLENAIDFNEFGGKHSNCCTDNHLFVRLDNKLKCIRCGATSKVYKLTEKQLDFLTLCADKQKMLIGKVTTDDLPFLKVLLSDKKNHNYESLSPRVKEEEEWLDSESIAHELSLKVKKAHALDNQQFDNKDFHVTNPKYLSDEVVKLLLKDVSDELDRIKETDSKFKDLMIEECKVAMYEILILSGKNIPKLLEEAKEEDDKIALTKAYYNISKEYFRVNSDYFASSNSVHDAISYDCLTANKEINNRILQMKSK